jgi:hypothetical protein
MTTFNIHEAKTHFSKLLERVLKGEEVIIAKAGKPMVMAEFDAAVYCVFSIPRY